MFERILIANRGEIAVRIIRTCREMGIGTVAVYTGADRGAMHTQLADEAVCIGEAGQYMNGETILRVARDSGADAVHPGYGFLAENPAFARLLGTSGITFIGPQAQAIELLGNKALARKVALSARVPVVPGSRGIVKNLDEAKAVAREIGYPVMLKAVFGGGGRGMRAAFDEEELAASFLQAAKEAAHSFNSAELYLEKYIHNFKHIEIQILADKYGHAVYLGERDCSVQRRHQKLIEEAPCPKLSLALREELGRAAIAVARAAHYSNAGTAEFMVDSNQNYYFMEMNTRIQVEHPVTEMITGVDLVKEQIRLAAGLPLSLSQRDVTVSGWAIECRINAEHPDTFMPCPGVISAHQAPGGYGVRVDTAACQGSSITNHYDSLVSKLIVWGQSRQDAVLRMIRSLEEYRIEGIQTTIPFLLQVLRNTDFLEGGYNTDLIHRKIKLKSQELKETAPGAVSGPPEMDPCVLAAIAAALALCQENRATGPVAPPRAVINRQSPWRSAGLQELMHGY